MSAPSGLDSFPLFPLLLPELREYIWKLCLPYRIRELDLPDPVVLFRHLYISGPDQAPCRLFHTSYMNAKVPVIGHVCRESRQVALRAAGLLSPGAKEFPTDAHNWRSATLLDEGGWEDKFRDIPHLHWHDVYRENDFAENGHSLAYAASKASCVETRTGSLMLDRFRDHHVSNEFEHLNSVRKWLVVTDTFVVHASIADAGGYFGLLGDAPIQVVDYDDEPRLTALLNLASNIEDHCPVDIMDYQSFETEAPNALKERFRENILKKLGSETLARKLRLAMMFRLCTKMCNHIDLTQDVEDDTVGGGTECL